MKGATSEVFLSLLLPPPVPQGPYYKSKWHQNLPRPVLRIPDTGILQNDRLVAWLFTSKQSGEVLRKKSHNCRLDKLHDTFVSLAKRRKNGPHPICVLLKDHDRPLVLSGEDYYDWYEETERKQRGFTSPTSAMSCVQAFVPPANDAVFDVRVTQSEDLTEVSIDIKQRRYSAAFRSLSRTLQYPILQKIASSATPRSYRDSVHGGISDSIQRKLKHLTLQVVQYVESVRHVRVRGMTLQWIQEAESDSVRPQYCLIGIDDVDLQDLPTESQLRRPFSATNPSTKKRVFRLTGAEVPRPVNRTGGRGAGEVPALDMNPIRSAGQRQTISCPVSQRQTPRSSAHREPPPYMTSSDNFRYMRSADMAASSRSDTREYMDVIPSLDERNPMVTTSARTDDDGTYSESDGGGDHLSESQMVSALDITNDIDEDSEVYDDDDRDSVAEYIASAPRQPPPSHSRPKSAYAPAKSSHHPPPARPASAHTVRPLRRLTSATGIADAAAVPAFFRTMKSSIDRMYRTQRAVTDGEREPPPGSPRLMRSASALACEPRVPEGRGEREREGAGKVRGHAVIAVSADERRQAYEDYMRTTTTPRAMSTSPPPHATGVSLAETIRRQKSPSKPPKVPTRPPSAPPARSRTRSTKSSGGTIVNTAAKPPARRPVSAGAAVRSTFTGTTTRHTNSATATVSARPRSALSLSHSQNVWSNSRPSSAPVRPRPISAASARSTSGPPPQQQQQLPVRPLSASIPLNNNPAAAAVTRWPFTRRDIPALNEKRKDERPRSADPEAVRKSYEIRQILKSKEDEKKRQVSQQAAREHQAVVDRINKMYETVRLTAEVQDKARQLHELESAMASARSGHSKDFVESAKALSLQDPTALSGFVGYAYGKGSGGTRGDVIDLDLEGAVLRELKGKLNATEDTLEKREEVISTLVRSREIMEKEFVRRSAKADMLEKQLGRIRTEAEQKLKYFKDRMRKAEEEMKEYKRKEREEIRSVKRDRRKKLRDRRERHKAKQRYQKWRQAVIEGTKDDEKDGQHQHHHRRGSASKSEMDSPRQADRQPTDRSKSHSPSVQFQVEETPRSIIEVEDISTPSTKAPTSALRLSNIQPVKMAAATPMLQVTDSETDENDQRATSMPTAAMPGQLAVEASPGDGGNVSDGRSTPVRGILKQTAENVEEVKRQQRMADQMGILKESGLMDHMKVLYMTQMDEKDRFRKSTIAAGTAEVHLMARYAVPVPEGTSFRVQGDPTMYTMLSLDDSTGLLSFFPSSIMTWEGDAVITFLQARGDDEDTGGDDETMSVFSEISGTMTETSMGTTMTSDSGVSSRRGPRVPGLKFSMDERTEIIRDLLKSQRELDHDFAQMMSDSHMDLTRPLNPAKWEMPKFVIPLHELDQMTESPVTLNSPDRLEHARGFSSRWENARENQLNESRVNRTLQGKTDYYWERISALREKLKAAGRPDFTPRTEESQADSEEEEGSVYSEEGEVGMEDFVSDSDSDAESTREAAPEEDVSETIEYDDESDDEAEDAEEGDSTTEM